MTLESRPNRCLKKGDGNPQRQLEVPVQSHRWRRMHLALGLLVLLTTLGCPRTPPPSVANPSDRATVDDSASDMRRLQMTVADQQRTIDQMSAEIGRLQLRAMEREARYQALVDEMTAQQERLDEAVLEVVRAKAKLRSIESRAEAASSIAEAEIALKGLKDILATAARVPDEEVRKAEALLRMSTTEFRKENYGGALYLAGQTQSQIRSIQSQLDQQDNPSSDPGEVRFAHPVPLKVLKRSNLRAGPSLGSKIRLTLAADAPIVGYAYKEKWIRVQTADGTRGWIFQSLVGSR